MTRLKVENFRGWIGSGRSSLKKAALFVVAAAITALVGLALNDWWEGRKPAYVLIVEKNPDRISIATGTVGDSAGYVVTGRSIGEIGPPPIRDNVCQGRYEWATERYQAADADSSTARITLEGRKDEEVQLYDVDIEKLAEDKLPRSGLHLACPGQGGKPDIRRLDVDLDDPSLAVRASDASGAIPLLFTVEKGGSEVIDVSATTAACDCLWEATLHLRSGDREFTERVGPFHTVASIELPTYHWIDGDWLDIDGDPAPIEAPPPPPAVAACELITREEAAAFLRSGVREPTGGPSQPTQGASGATVQLSMCSFASDREADPDADPQGLIDSITVFYGAAASPEDADEEYEALLEGFGRQATGRPAHGFGEEATIFDGVLVARFGREILQVQVSASDPALMRRVDGLADVVAARAWR